MSVKVYKLGEVKKGGFVIKDAKEQARVDSLIGNPLPIRKFGETVARVVRTQSGVSVKRVKFSREPSFIIDLNHTDDAVWIYEEAK